MKVEWLKKIYKENKYIMLTSVGAMILLVILSMSVVWYKFRSVREELIPDVQVAELQQDSTLEGITDTRNIVLYFMEALDKNNLDMALRGFPIDEIGLGVDTAKIIEGKFSNNLTVAPSKVYRQYFPLTSAELTAQYTEMFSEAVKEYQKLGDVEVKDVSYVYPKKQTESAYILESQNLCDMTGAEAESEKTVLLEH